MGWGGGGGGGREAGRQIGTLQGSKDFMTVSFFDINSQL